MSRAQEIRNAVNTHSAAQRAFEMINQQRQHQQFGGRPNGIKPRAPWRIGPQRADHRQRKQRDRRRADRTPQRLQEGPQIEGRQPS